MQRMLLISTMLILVAPNCLASPDEPSSAEEFAQRGQERIQKGEYEKSIADLTEAINLDPDRNYYVMRACVWELAKKYDKAIADCDVAIKGNPRDPTPYVFRGMAWTEKNEIEKAVDDFDMAIKLDPKNAAAYRSRANAWARNGDYRTAGSGYEKALELDPADPDSWNDYAWFEATCPEAKYRNGKRAVERATKACEFTHFKQSPFLDTLAAANAELGDFASAVKWQTRARDAAPASERPDYQSRLDLYKAHKPCRSVARD